MKILSWNINGIRASKINLKKLFDSLDADIICLQETKVTRMVISPFCIKQIILCKQTFFLSLLVRSYMSITPRECEFGNFGKIKKQKTQKTTKKNTKKPLAEFLFK